ncbi:hypothetical protein AALO_G00284730 [Alosa alosa]|uniref:Uncharacterized protein n=1 Tax=Alosa alosa TaxID=278164 RepID=A0AAV6FFN7_9TELE|nr:hypothetical protein AALO_G00284730 [Alosa alosa]
MCDFQTLLLQELCFKLHDNGGYGFGVDHSFWKRVGLKEHLIAICEPRHVNRQPPRDVYKVELEASVGVHVWCTIIRSEVLLFAGLSPGVYRAEPRSSTQHRLHSPGLGPA